MHGPGEYEEGARMMYNGMFLPLAGILRDDILQLALFHADLHDLNLVFRHGRVDG